MFYPMRFVVLARERGRCGQTLLEKSPQGRRRTKRVRRCVHWSAPRNPVQGVQESATTSLNLAGVGSIHLATNESGLTGPATALKRSSGK